MKRGTNIATPTTYHLHPEEATPSLLLEHVELLAFIYLQVSCCYSTYTFGPHLDPFHYSL